MNYVKPNYSAADEWARPVPCAACGGLVLVDFERRPLGRVKWSARCESLTCANRNVYRGPCRAVSVRLWNTAQRKWRK